MYIQWLPAQTQQINLKTFYPFIAYMFDSVRRLAPTQERNNAKHSDPFIEGMFEKLGRRINPNPSASLHPALRHKILRAPIPGSRRATSTENNLHHTIVLGEEYDLQISDLPSMEKLPLWWKGHEPLEGLQMFLHVIRENSIFEITVAISLLILSEIYSTHMVKSSGYSEGPCWESRGCFRLEYGHSPVSDFGICRGRIQGKANRVQTWTYYNPKTSSQTTVLDPNKHYWLYFRTIKSEELVLDCCSFSYGMEGCVDASLCLKKLPSGFRDWGSARTPVYFYASQRSEKRPNSHALIEEKRFSVMQNSTLYAALGWDLFGGRNVEQHEIVRNFMNEVQGRPPTFAQEERVRDYRTFGALMFGQILVGKNWKEWEKPVTHSRDESLDLKKPKRDVFHKGSKLNKECDGKLNCDAMGMSNF